MNTFIIFQKKTKICTLLNNLLGDASLILNKQETNKKSNSENSINTTLIYKIESVKQFTDNNVPNTKLPKSKLKFKPKPWITKGIVKSRKHKKSCRKILHNQVY